ncbi:unnamed protein product [Cyprideis torosa]|uniref:Uncharacterized protein n=1 Tax=Cyprideis torosa TaxID=163714 RepID=A0A7R8WJT1_9CRUS|nr:unnamed protein product [Cyprideis torosa]CAG0896123.1 unnamed protein product [Cyprideis torosa]
MEDDCLGRMQDDCLGRMQDDCLGRMQDDYLLSQKTPEGCPPPPSADYLTKPQRSSSLEIETLLKTATEVTTYCRTPEPGERRSPTGSVSSTYSQHSGTGQLTVAERLRKIILELVDTERTYVTHLNNLIETYMDPLSEQSFLSPAEFSTLFGNIREIVSFQRVFLRGLEEAIQKEGGFMAFELPHQYRTLLFSLGNVFLLHVRNFKLYSSFCASHSKAQRILHPGEGNQALLRFLSSRNPKQQHSLSLESYLIKPIQRILKYPLLLQQLRGLTAPGSEEHQHLGNVLREMENVAEHINEMQRIHEEYGAIFDHLIRQYYKSPMANHPNVPGKITPVDLSPGELLFYGGVEWLNITDFLGKIKKGLELHAMCFVFNSAVVFLCKEKLRQRKKLMGGGARQNGSEVEIIRYQMLIPVSEVQVRSSTVRDTDTHFLWELLHLRGTSGGRRTEKVYHLSNSTSDLRNTFLRTIRGIIRESVRNMNIPSTPGHSGASNGRIPNMNAAGGNNPGASTNIRQNHSKTLGGANKKRSRNAHRHSVGNIEDEGDAYDSDTLHPDLRSHSFRGRSRTFGADSSDSGKDNQDVNASDEEDGEGQTSAGNTGSMGRRRRRGRQAASAAKTSAAQPQTNHLSFSSTSTISGGSSGSQARLVQASGSPGLQAQQATASTSKPLGSPVWKPREGETAFPLPPANTEKGRQLIVDEYGGNPYTTPPIAKKEAGSSHTPRPLPVPPPKPRPDLMNPPSPLRHLPKTTFKREVIVFFEDCGRPPPHQSILKPSTSDGVPDLLET